MSTTISTAFVQQFSSNIAMLSQQMQQIGRILEIHAAVVGQANMNGDLKRNLQCKEKEMMHL